MLVSRPSTTTVRRLAIALLVANIGIVVTGGAVRLTGSGLGCPTWPRCTEDSYVPHGELGIHGALEFGNRLMTFVLIAIALTTWLALRRARPYRRVASWLSLGIDLGIPLQAVIGGITVLTDLNPWVVSLHLMLSMGLIAACVVLLRRIVEDDGPTRPTVPGPVRTLAWLTTGAAVGVIYLGTIVTGSGPHAGDINSPRNGLDPDHLSQLHADGVFLLLGLTIGILLAFRAVDAPRRAQRAAMTLLVVELAQGAVGFVQYFTGLPILIVGLHLFGAALVMACATWTLLGVREREPLLDEPTPTVSNPPFPPRTLSR